MLIFVFMRIEDEIKQKVFDSNLQKSLINLIFTSNCYKDKLQKIFKEFDLSHQHYNILRILNGKHPESVTPGYIKEVMLEKGTDLTRILDKLDRKNLITRSVCPTNRRNIDIHITDAGIKLLDRISPILIQLEMTFAQRFDNEDAILLNHLLDKLRG